MLLDAKSSPKEYDYRNLTPSTFAMHVKKLLKKKAHVDDMDGDHRSSLIHAIAVQNVDIAKYVLKHKGDVNADCNELMTPVAYGVQTGNADMFRALLDAKATSRTVR